MLRMMKAVTNIVQTGASSEEFIGTYLKLQPTSTSLTANVSFNCQQNKQNEAHQYSTSNNNGNSNSDNKK
jgi:hypothetical protein